MNYTTYNIKKEDGSNLKRNGGKYEQKVAKKMRWKGYWKIKMNGKSGDYGADIIARDLLFRRVVVQCKCYSNPVGVRAVQEVIAAREYYGAKKAIVATNSIFTNAAKKLAKKCKVVLWEKYR